MASSVRPGEVLSLYRKLLRQSNLFHSFNYRSYALRRVRDSFREKKGIKDPHRMQEEYERGLQSLSMLERQTSISRLYSAPKLVVEQ